MANQFDKDINEDTHLLNETYHVFSKSPASPTTTLSGARLKSGHTVTSGEVWSEEIPAFFNAVTSEKFALFQTLAVKDDLCLYNGEVHQHDGSAFVSLGAVDTVLVDGKTFQKNGKDVIKYHKDRQAINLTAENNNGDSSNNHAAKIYNAAADSTEFVKQFISGTDKFVGGVPSSAYDAVVKADAVILAEGLTSDEDYVCNAFAGVIQFNKARTQGTVTVSAWEYIGKDLATSLNEVHAAVFGGDEAGLVEKVAANAADITALENTVWGEEGTVEEPKDGSVLKNVAGNTERITTAETEIDTLQAEVVTLQETVKNQITHLLVASIDLEAKTYIEIAKEEEELPEEPTPEEPTPEEPTPEEPENEEPVEPAAEGDETEPAEGEDDPTVPEVPEGEDPAVPEEPEVTEPQPKPCQPNVIYIVPTETDTLEYLCHLNAEEEIVLELLGPATTDLSPYATKEELIAAKKMLIKIINGDKAEDNVKLVQIEATSTLAEGEDAITTTLAVDTAKLDAKLVEVDTAIAAINTEIGDPAAEGVPATGLHKTIADLDAATIKGVTKAGTAAALTVTPITETQTVEVAITTVPATGTDEAAKTALTEQGYVDEKLALKLDAADVITYNAGTNVNITEASGNPKQKYIAVPTATTDVVGVTTVSSNNAVQTSQITHTAAATVGAVAATRLEVEAKINDLTDADGPVTKLTTRVATAESEIDTLQTDVGKLKGTGEGSVFEAKTLANTAKATAEGVQTTVTTLTNRVTAAETKMGEIPGTSTAQTIVDYVNEVAAGGAEVAGVQSILEGNSTENYVQLTVQTGSTATLTINDSALKTAIDTINTEIGEPGGAGGAGATGLYALINDAAGEVTEAEHNALKARVDVLEGTDTTDGSVKKTVKDAIGKLDVNYSNLNGITLNQKDGIVELKVNEASTSGYGTTMLTTFISDSVDLAATPMMVKTVSDKVDSTKDNILATKIAATGTSTDGNVTVTLDGTVQTPTLSVTTTGLVTQTQLEEHESGVQTVTVEPSQTSDLVYLGIIGGTAENKNAFITLDDSRLKTKITEITNEIGEPAGDGSVATGLYALIAAGGGGGGGSGEAGEDGGYYTPEVAEDGTLSWTPSKTGMATVESVNIKGPKGDPGMTGNTGADGEDGEDGGYYTPEVNTEGVLSWTGSKEGMPTVTTINVKGPQGDAGTDGEDGGYYTPAVDAEGNLTWTRSKDTMPEGPASISIKGPQGDAGMTGNDGEDGEDGGYYTPTVTPEGTITWTRSKETMPEVPASASIKGDKGAVFTPAVSEAGELSWTNDGELDNPSPVNIKGENGATFTPTVSEAGVLSWTNDKELQNPAEVTIKGTDGGYYKPAVSETGDLSWTVEGIEGAEAPATVNVKGDKGAVFTPSVADDGTLSWTNDGDLQNPDPVNIKGESGITEEQLELLLAFANSEGKNIPIESTSEGSGFPVVTGHTYVVINTQSDMAILVPQPSGDPVQVDLMAGRQTAIVAMTGTADAPAYVLVEYTDGTVVTEVFRAAAPINLGSGGGGGYDHYSGGFDVDDNGVIKPDTLVIPAYTFKGLSFQAFEFPENYQFSATLPFLYDGSRMFKHSVNLKSFTNASATSRFNHLEYCDNMFLGAMRLESVNEDFSYVKSAEGCFSLCLALTSWDKSLRSLKNGKDMFSGSGLTSFSLPDGENFASLENAENMFYGTNLDIATVLKVLDYLPDKSPETLECYHGPYPFGISIENSEEAVYAFGNKTGIWGEAGHHVEGEWKGWTISLWLRGT